MGHLVPEVPDKGHLPQDHPDMGYLLPPAAVHSLQGHPDIQWEH